MDEQYIIDLKVKTPGIESATKKIKDLEAEMSKLDKTTLEYKQKLIDIERIQNASGNSFGSFGNKVDEAKGSMTSAVFSGNLLSDAFNNVSQQLINTAKEVIAIEKEFTKLQKTVGRTSGLVGTALNKATASVSALANTFGKDTDEINNAANAFAKTTGTSYTKALSLIEKGFLQGADANGEFLDGLAEYPIQLKNAGFAAEEFIKVISQGVNSGIYSDKLLDSIKEADLALKEQSKATRDSLVTAFGAVFTDDLLKRIRNGSTTTKQALIEIKKESEKTTLSLKQQQDLTANIFKAAGEDAGGFAVVLDQVDTALKSNLNSLDGLGEAQRRQLTLQKELSLESVRLSDNLAGLSTSLDNIWTNIKVTGLDALNSLIEKLTSAGKLITAIQDNTSKLIAAGDKVAINKAIQETEASITALEKQKIAAKETGDVIIGTRNAIRAAQLAAELDPSFNKQLLSGEIDALLTEQRNALKLLQDSLKTKIKPLPTNGPPGETEEEKKKRLEEERKKALAALEAQKKKQKELIELEKTRFNQLKKSFENNFESQRLEAQKLFLNGLITEEELASRIFAINQQESDVIITITANKKEIAKTGQESLDISTEEVKKLKGISDELDRQLAVRQKIRDAERSIQDSEFSISSSELRVEEENAVQALLTDTSIKNEEKRQKKIEKVRKQFAIRQRQLAIEDTKRQIDDAAKAAAELQKELDEASANGPSEEIDIIKTSKLAEDIALIQKLKAELGLLNTQQTEAEKNLKKPEKTLVERAEQYNGYIQEITKGLQEAVQADIAATDTKLNAQETRIQAGIELAKLGNDELLNQELERQEKLLEEREKQANREKAIAAIQVAANLGVAIAKAAADGGVLAPATIALVLGAVGIGFASIGALVGGAFADGVIDFKGKGTERSDSNIVAISRGESVITAKGTKNASKMLTMINEGKLSDSDYLTAGLDLQPIQTVNQAIDIRNELNQQIALSSELLEEMRNFYTKIEFDARGVHQTVNTKNKRITKINSR